jgi:DNA-binding CsgD family transcriptional regulator
MDSILDIAGKRSERGVIVFDRNCRVLFMNEEASRITASFLLDGAIAQLCDHMKNLIKEMTVSNAVARKCMVMNDETGTPYSASPFPIGLHGNGQATHIMVLFDKVAKRRRADLDRAATMYQLTARESGVLELLCEGHKNKEIAKLLSITEQTVKDHLSNIMRKMGLHSRSAIISYLK